MAINLTSILFKKNINDMTKEEVDKFYNKKSSLGYDSGYRIAIFSLYDAIMPCAAMPTAPMQFDMGKLPK